MLLALLLALAPAVTQADGSSPITVKLNHDQFTLGDHARVTVKTARDGYLVVLHADPQGRVRILFPLDPTDDAFVRGGKRQELRGRSDRDAFTIDNDDGAGTVLAAFSNEPFSYDGYVVNEHWDFRALGGPSATVKDDPLAGLLDIVRKMSGESHFDYDAATYVVGRDVAMGYGYRHPYGYSYPRFRLGFGYAYDPFYDPFCYDPFYSWSASCYGYGGGFGFGFGYSYYRPRLYGFSRPFIGGGFGRGSRFVIPRNRDRFAPVQPRPRSDVINPSPRSWGTGSSQPRIAPRTRSGGGWSGGRPSVSRGGGMRPAPRPSNGRGGSGGGGGRRH